MTHDELLAKINNLPEVIGLTEFKVRHDALRAVVEVLKGYDDGQARVNEEFNQGVLSLSNVIKEAIEKELA